MRESDLLKHIYNASRRMPDHVIVPPGDDMAAVRFGDQTVLITVDQLADGVHVNLENVGTEAVARKAVTRNLSDVAAMAARPRGAVVAAALPRDFGEDRATQLFDAMRQTAEQYDCPLVGGDITIWAGPLMLTVTVFAEPDGVDPVLRSGAKPGDVICVTGQLGGAWEADGGGAHLSFEPHIDLARKLAGFSPGALHSMIDLSDGLASDLSHICTQSRRAAEIHTRKLPTRVVGPDAADRALFDGEDYELCFTMNAEAAGRLPESIDGVPITPIGHILPLEDKPYESSIWLRHEDGRREPLTKTGWDHHS